MQQTKPVHLRTGRVKNIDGIEAIKPFVRLASKGRFQNVIFYIQDFANLWVLQEDIATKRPCWVYYITMYGSHNWHPTLIYNTQRRGLAELLISVERQCEGQGCGISDRKFTPTSFLFHKILLLTSRNRESR